MTLVSTKLLGNLHTQEQFTKTKWTQVCVCLGWFFFVVCLFHLIWTFSFDFYCLILREIKKESEVGLVSKWEDCRKSWERTKNIINMLYKKFLNKKVKVFFIMLKTSVQSIYTHFSGQKKNVNSFKQNHFQISRPLP